MPRHPFSCYLRNFVVSSSAVQNKYNENLFDFPISFLHMHAASF